MIQGEILAAVLLIVSTSGSVNSESPILQQYRCPQNYIIGQLGCGAYEVALDLQFALEVPMKATQTFNRKSAPQKLQRRDGPVPTIDKTVSYMEDLDAPVRLKALCDFKSPPKFAVMLCDPAARTWHHFVGEGRMNPKSKNTATQYRQCIDRTLSILTMCLRQNTYEQCGRLLYAGMNSGETEAPDALGNSKPCAGIIYNSMYEQQLQNWFAMFPSKDFLILYKEDWEQSPAALLNAFSKHFNISVAKRNPGINLKDGLPPDTTQYAPEETQVSLREFFDARRGWVRYTAAAPKQPPTQTAREEPGTL